jgi:hypothetical protein
MPNPNPQTDQLKPHQYQPLGDRPMGKVVGTRYPVDVEAVLNSLDDKQGFIRQCVEAGLRDRGLL